MHEGEDVVVALVHLAEVEVQAVAEHLRLGVPHGMLGDQEHQRRLLLPAASELLVGCTVVGQEELVEQRQDHLRPRRRPAAGS